MKTTNKKRITLMLVGALCSATLGGIFARNALDVVPTFAAEATKSVSDVFTVDGKKLGSVGAKKVSESDEKETVAFTLSNSGEDSGKVSIKRDLAYAWYEGKNDARYFNMTFAFENLNFKSVSFVMENAPAVAMEEEKASNTLKFTKDGDKIYASVFNEEEEDTVNKKEISLSAGQDVKFSFAKAQERDEFLVVLVIGSNRYEIGSFTNIGANYADYSADTMSPLSVSADLDEGVSTVVLLKDINGQRFDNVTEKDGVKHIADTAAPVLVLNEDLNGFMLGTKIFESLSYVSVDVLQSSSLSEKKEFYHYSPLDAEAKYEDITSSWSSTLVMDTTYYVNASGDVKTEAAEGYRLTSVYREDGREYVAAKITLGDNAFNEAEGEWAKKTYDLSWYAPAFDPTDATREVVVSKNGVDCIIADRNTQGPSYKYITADEATKTNVIADEAAFEAQIATYQNLLAKNAKGVYAGSGSYMYFPSLEWLLQDNNGYRGLRFVISYKTPTSTSASTSAIKTYSALSLSASAEGTYEFKVFASDKAGNPMHYYLDGELVEVTSNNVWDIEEIPSFSYEIENLGIKAEASSASNRKSSKNLNETYTFSDPTIKGATNKKSAYALYKLDFAKYNDTVASGKTEITWEMLADITYESLAKKLDGRITLGADYFDLYITAYAELLAEKLVDNVTSEDIAKVKAIFGEAIGEYNDKITEDDPEWAYNKYQWKPSSKSFKAVEKGTYFVVADYWEQELPMQRAAAYKVINVKSEGDVIKGETQWLKNNIVSVVLFSIAAVMLVCIIILLFVKPSDETLEDVEKKAAKKNRKKKSTK